MLLTNAALLHFVRAGAHVFSVAALRYSKRARILAEHNAFYNWATDDLPRPLYHYTMDGEAIAWPQDDE
jgi:hypothetical protein